MSLDELYKLIVNISEMYVIGTPYVVGGLPRDIYMKKSDIKTNDIDLTTNSNEVLRLGLGVAEELNVTFDLSDDTHLTVFSDNYDLDFSSNFISDAAKSYLNGDKQDLLEVYSRDFTINTLMLNLKTREVEDPTGKGFDDIDNKIIRTPVPPDITLTDDPRRIYRAINLAARYGYTIHDDIKEFVSENKDIFIDNVKDKYITVKISKALSENEDLTLELLKELGLLRLVPLSGRFKDTMIRRKMLASYLDKSASISRWKEYSDQGPDYLDIEKFWKKHHKEIEESSSRSFRSWASWYMSNFNGKWENDHKSPEETIKIMKEVLDKDIENPSDGRLEGFVSNLKNKVTKLKGKEKSLPRSKMGVNLSKLNDDVINFLYRLTEVANDGNFESPVITSGYRSPKGQVRLMHKNWENNGKKEYLIDLYGKDFGTEMSKIFEKYKRTKEWLPLGLEILLAQKNGSYHLSGRAVDLRMTDGIKEMIDIINDFDEFDLKIIDESSGSNPHMHVAVLGSSVINYADDSDLANNIPLDGSPFYPRIFFGDSVKQMGDQFNEQPYIDDNITNTWHGLMSFNG